MKAKSKILIIALFLSLMFSVGAVAASEDMTFEQSNIEDVSLGTPDVNPEDSQDMDYEVSPSASKLGGGHKQMIY